MAIFTTQIISKAKMRFSSLVEREIWKDAVSFEGYTYEAMYNPRQNNKIAFLDRDGTLIYEPQDTFQVDTVEQLKILPGVISGLKKLVSLGYSLVMITNQNGIGTEQFPEEGFWRAQNALIMILAQKAICFDKVLICPHLPEANCRCRKPKMGLVTEYLKAMDKKESLLIGDRQTDIILANKMGIISQLMPTNGNFLKAVENCLRLKGGKRENIL